MTSINACLGGNLLRVIGSDSPNDIFGTVDPASSHNLIGDAATTGGLTPNLNQILVNALLSRPRRTGYELAELS